ncbi:MAG: O-antigen ligase family protein [Candidatus Omnitrophica bacterium]|nr:O-antigen ligase family protein [Candidatus Omnitrophota bacterium]
MKKAFSIILLPVLVAATAASSFISGPFKLMILVLSALLFFVAVVKTDMALIILIFSMLFSPEFSLGGVSGRAVVVRFDDIFIFVIFFGWLAKMAINKELGLIRITFLNRPILAYIAVYAIATLIGLLMGPISLKEGVFYLLKYFEYFLLFFMVSNCLNDKEQAAFFIRLILFVGLAISIYACWQHLTGVERVSAPFEGEGGEANTLGGYLMMIILLSISLLLNTSGFKFKAFLYLIIFSAVPALLFTLSRSSWIAFAFGLLALIFLTTRGRVVLFVVFVATIVLSSVIFPAFVINRVTSTFESTNKYTVMNRHMSLDESAIARIESWHKAYRMIVKSPFIGHGASSAGPTVDNQYARILIEAGVLGLLAFIWMAMAILKNCFIYLNELKDDDFSRGFFAGFMAVFIALLVHSFGAASFILIRIMEPFWFLMALVVVLAENAPFIKSSAGS